MNNVYTVSTRREPSDNCPNIGRISEKVGSLFLSGGRSVSSVTDASPHLTHWLAASGQAPAMSQWKGRRQRSGYRLKSRTTEGTGHWIIWWQEEEEEAGRGNRLRHRSFGDADRGREIRCTNELLNFRRHFLFRQQHSSTLRNRPFLIVFLVWVEINELSTQFEGWVVKTYLVTYTIAILNLAIYIKMTIKVGFRPRTTR